MANAPKDGTLGIGNEDISSGKLGMTFVASKIFKFALVFQGHIVLLSVAQYVTANIPSLVALESIPFSQFGSLPILAAEQTVLPHGSIFITCTDTADTYFPPPPPPPALRDNLRLFRTRTCLLAAAAADRFTSSSFCLIFFHSLLPCLLSTLLAPFLPALTAFSHLLIRTPSLGPWVLSI